MTVSTANNRSLTLAGANKIFEAIGIEIAKHDLGYYYCDYLGRRWQRQTLTELCVALVKEYMQPNHA